MAHLLSIEWLKLKKYRTFWILIGFFVFLLPVWNYGISDGFLKIGGKNSINLLDQAYTFSGVWGNMGWWTSIFVVFISILVIIITTNEYNYRTHRQNVIDGLSRMQFFHTKHLLVVTLAVLTTLYAFITGSLFGLANDTAANFPGDLTKVFYIFLLSLNYYSFGLLLGFLFKRSGLAIGMFFLYFMIIENLLGSMINWKLDVAIGNFLPLQASDELLPFPLIDTVKAMAQMEDSIPAYAYVIASFAWIIIYYLIGRSKLVKSDW